MDDAELRQRVSTLFPDGKWPQNPWAKRPKRVPVDMELAGNLFALIPEWAGDWADFEPYLRDRNYPRAELPDVSVKIVSSVAAVAAQAKREERASRGLLPLSGVGTSVSSYVRVELVEPATRSTTADERDKTASEVANQLDKPTLAYALVMLAELAVCGANTKTDWEIRRVLGSVMPSIEGKGTKTICENLTAEGMYEYKQGPGGGRYLTPWGVEVAKCARNVVNMDDVMRELDRLYGSEFDKDVA